MWANRTQKIVKTQYEETRHDRRFFHSGADCLRHSMSENGLGSLARITAPISTQLPPCCRNGLQASGCPFCAVPFPIFPREAVVSRRPLDEKKRTLLVMTQGSFPLALALDAVASEEQRSIFPKSAMRAAGEASCSQKTSASKPFVEKACCEP